MRRVIPPRQRQRLTVRYECESTRKDAILSAEIAHDVGQAPLRIAMTLNQVGAADLGELISHVEMFGGYLACNLPDDRPYFLRDADLTGMWPDEKTSETIVQTLQARLSSQFAPYELDYIRKYLRAGDIGRLELNPPCVLGYTTLYIASNGDVRSGCYVLSPLGNIIQQDLVAILQSPEYRARWGRPNTRVTSRHLNMSTSAADPERS